jgi:hypothetical protein
MSFVTKNMDKLLQNPTTKNLFILNTVFPQVIPFNRPHKFKIKSMDLSRVEVFAPLIRNNKNHLGTFHAIAQATIGELSAGLLLLRNFGMNKYRFILSNISIEYTFQAKTNLLASAEITSQEVATLEKELVESSKALINLTTTLKDTNSNVVSIVTTTWQLKNWAKVQTNKQ